MESLTIQFEQLASSANENSRIELLTFAESMVQKLESPAEKLHRISMAAAQVHVAETLIELAIFELIEGSPDPISEQSIAEKLYIDIGLISRLLRAACSHGMLEQVGPGMYTANAFTSKLACKGHQPTLLHMVKTVMPAWASLSTWMQAQKDPGRAAQLPVNIALTGDRSIFEYLSQPENAVRLSYASALMGHWKQGTSDWLSVYPVETAAKDLNPERALFVDVGGGLGHQCQLFSQKYPDLKGRIVLEDRPEVLYSAPPIDGVEFVAQDFFQEQSIKGAKIYYLRWILHDWPAHACLLILRGIRSAMATDSCIIVDDMTIPPTTPHPYATAMDLTMMSLFGGLERTSAQWDHIFTQSGLTRRRSWVYDRRTGDGVMELVRSEEG